MTGADVVAEARRWDKTRWAHQGRSTHGVDCVGLVIMVGRSLGLLDFDTRDYRPQASDESMLELCREHLTAVGRDAMQVGDVAVMRFQNNRHIGIVGDYPYGGFSVIHATTMFPHCVVENRLDDAWLRAVKGSFMAAFRFRGLAA